ncbi:hypothetical protein LSH36_561g02043 [Paralvinella palmiformis]|uniref:Copper chaperone for superoxide dismutase n=1 Tax=Paralvinella palmiformis TaxID=53620 RepID=A0AAD9MX14_9ANNE|nr:hypothetical protein LSH36_561g02043 [Paralvinella palmiformis]
MDCFQLEFAVQMTCQSCVDAIKNVLEAHKGDGHLGAAVSIVTGSSGCQGIVRMIQKNGELCTLEADPKGRLEFRIESTLLKVWDIIGRSLVIHHHNNDKDERVACGVVARSAGLFQNPKRICACDGVALWDERDVPAAGVGRQRAAAQAQL